MYYVYLLESKKDGSRYTGFTGNLKRRIKEHNEGKNKSTKNKLPFKIIYFEGFINKNDAKTREIYLKSGWGKRTLKKLLINYNKES